MNPKSDPDGPTSNTPDFIDENPNTESVEMGLRVAENELRDLTEEELPNEDLEDGELDPVAPEVAAIRTEI